MKVGLFIDPKHAVPPRGNTIVAPWFIVKDMADGLSERGHEVYLFAAKGSRTKAKLYHAGLEATYELKDKLNPREYKELVTERQKKLFDLAVDTARQEGLDILHINQPVDPSLLKNLPIPVVVTLHNAPAHEPWDILSRMAKMKNIYFVAISNSQKKDTPLHFFETVYHGIDINFWKFESQSGNYFLVSGRLMEEKGQDDAITVVRQTGVKLLILAKFYADLKERNEFYEKFIEPFIDGKSIIMKGVLSREELRESYRKAKAFLFPIKWEEPFGLVMIEAMACGTPVIAYGRGSVPEVVKDGITGYIVQNSEFSLRPELRPRGIQNSEREIKQIGEKGLAEAIEKIKTMDDGEYHKMRENCRRHVEENFSTEKMVSGYESVYRKILSIR